MSCRRGRKEEGCWNDMEEVKYLVCAIECCQCPMIQPPATCSVLLPPRIEELPALIPPPPPPCPPPPCCYSISCGPCCPSPLPAPPPPKCPPPPPPPKPCCPPCCPLPCYPPASYC